LLRSRQNLGKTKVVTISLKFGQNKSCYDLVKIWAKQKLLRSRENLGKTKVVTISSKFGQNKRQDDNFDI
jgi:hypothetical protein